MMSDTIFETCSMAMRELAWMAHNDYGYEPQLYVDIMSDLAKFCARGIELDLGGDGSLDVSQFVSAEARESFIDDAKLRLKAMFDERIEEIKKEETDGKI